MQRFTIFLVLAGLIFAFSGCAGEAEKENGGDEAAANGEKVYKTAESLVDAFVKAANSQNKEVFFSLFYDNGSAEAIWERITESALTFSPGYHIEDGSFGKHVIFDSARWVGFDTYEQQLYVTDELGPGWLISGQDYAFVTVDEAGTAPEDAGGATEETGL